MSRIAFFTLDWMKCIAGTGQSWGWVFVTVSFFFPFLFGKEQSSCFAGKWLPTLPCGSCGSVGGEAKSVCQAGTWSSSPEATASLLEVVRINEYVGTCTTSLSLVSTLAPSCILFICLSLGQENLCMFQDVCVMKQDGVFF